MPSLSQNFTFLPSSTVNLDYPEPQTGSLTYYTNFLKGKGYYSSNEGLHTIQVKVSNFKGNITLEGTLSTNPTNNDWSEIKLGTGNFVVDTTGLASSVNVSSISYTQITSKTEIFNLKGNYVYIRVKVHNFTQGTVNYIKYNY